MDLFNKDPNDDWLDLPSLSQSHATQSAPKLSEEPESLGSSELHFGEIAANSPSDLAAHSHIHQHISNIILAVLHDRTVGLRPRAIEHIDFAADISSVRTVFIEFKPRGTLALKSLFAALPDIRRLLRQRLPLTFSLTVSPKDIG